MVTIAAFAEAASLCLAAVAPNGSVNPAGLKAQGWTSAKAPALVGGQYLQAFMKRDYPAILIMLTAQSKEACVVTSQVPEGEDFDVSQRYFEDTTAAIEISIHRKSSVIRDRVTFIADNATTATQADFTFDGKDYSFIAGNPS